MIFGRVSVVSLSIALCVALLAAMVPAAAFAQQGEKREYIVTIQVKDSGRNIQPTSRADKARIRQRAKAARLETNEIAQRNGVKAGFRYGNAITGFSARMTKAEARKLARDPSVTSVRPARTFKTSGEQVPVGVRRVKAYQGKPQPDVRANVAIIDTGIGPANSLGKPIAMTTNELRIAGGVNCYDDPYTGLDETVDQATYWGDTQGHGTHVAGIIGARDNGHGAVGVAPGANLFAVRVFAGRYTSEAAIVCGLDWVLDTYTNDTPDIDVVNMSIQGSRLDHLEDCGSIIGNVDADPIQAAICKLKAIDVPVVAAAGNSGANVNDSAPGGFDQVISVAAMTDTDGKGGANGPIARCSDGYGLKDDTFASYSNHGADIDIVAPGTCVWSTWYKDRSGDTLVSMSGTSMAAPHVTGAVARYVHANPGASTTVGELRQIIRAAGRMDWLPKSDPVWYGVNDPDPPNRVLDVAALTGAKGVRTFLYHDGFDVAGNETSFTTRVDVQRSGGYAGQVDLSTSGLPDAVGSTSLDARSLTGLGKNQLGTRLQLDLAPGGPEDIYDIAVEAAPETAGVSAHARSLRLTVDRTAPTVSSLWPKVRGQKTGMSLKGATQVYLQWRARDAVSGIRSAQLQRRTGTAAWRAAGVGGTSSSRVFLKPGQDNKFRVKVTDNVGHATISTVIKARLSVRDSKSSRFTKTGSWRTKSASKAFGGSLLVATAGQARLTTTFTAKAAAIVAPVGLGRGKFRVRVDGGAWKTVNTRTKSAGQRKVVWTARLDDGKHTLEVQRLAGKPAIDGLIIVR